MRRLELILAAWMAMSLAGCVLRGKQTHASAPPPTPAPAAKPAPAPPPQPLSIPQTQAQLPAPQTIAPGALATTTPPEPPAETQPAQRTTRRPTGPVAGPPRPETPPVQAPTPPAPATTEAERPPVQEIVPASESNRLRESAEARKQEIRKTLEQAQARTLSRDQRAVFLRIQTFVQQSDDAQKKGDMRLADALAQRAQVLARELQNGAR
jgi:hypothetical protein